MRHQTRVAVLPLVLAAGSAAAQCNYSVPDVPDFDQRRIAATGIPGLPGNGGMYCVPTQFVNWFAYLANNGLPQANTLAGPRSWQDNANYNRVTGVLDLMGDHMDTDPTEGTRGGSISGARAYAADNTGDDIVVVGECVWSGDDLFGFRFGPTPEQILDLHYFGAYLGGCYGFYTSSTGGTRNGGHAVTINGMWDVCGTATIMMFRDPADDSGNSTQSDFRTRMAVPVRVTGQFRAKDTESFDTVTMYRLDVTGASNNFLDTIFTMIPTAALVATFTDSGSLSLIRPFRPQGNPAPTTLNFPTPANTGVIRDVAFSPNPLVHYYITGPSGAAGGARIWKLNAVSGQSTLVLAPTNSTRGPSRLFISRFGDLYYCDDTSIYRYDLSTSPPTLLDSYTPTFAPEAIAYDDKNDTVVILSEAPQIGSRRVQTIPRSLSGFGTNRPLPFALDGIPCIQPDAETAGAFFVCSSGGGLLRRVVGQGSDLVLTDTITHLNGSLTGLNVTDSGRLVYANNGVLVEKERNTQGAWVNRPNSRWTGRAAAGPVSMARSRSNFNAAYMDHPAFSNLANPTLYPGLPTCYANCDQSTIPPILNVNDFVCFQQRFAAGHPYANCDNSTTAPVLNVNDFICYQTRFAQGCP